MQRWLAWGSILLWCACVADPAPDLSDSGRPVVEPPVVPVDVPTEGATPDGVRWSGALAEGLSCWGTQGGDQVGVMPIGAGYVGPGGAFELWLAQVSCGTATEMVDDPVLRWDLGSDKLVLAGSWWDRLGIARVAGWVGALSLVDLDADGDADLVTDLRGAQDALPVWLQDADGRFEPAELGAPAPFATGVGTPMVVDKDGDGHLDVLYTIPSEGETGARIGWVRQRARGDWTSDGSAFEPQPGLAGWVLVGASLRPAEVGVTHVVSATNDVSSTEEFTYELATGAVVPDTFFDLRRDPESHQAVNGARFLQPICANLAHTCLTTMGGGMLRHRTGEGWVDRLALTTGDARFPIGVFEPDPAAGRFWEDGAAAMGFAALIGPGGSSLWWDLETRWDVNADGVLDLIATAGHDAGVFDAMWVQAFLGGEGQPQAVRVPFEAGHAHGIGHAVLPRSDGTWVTLAWTATSRPVVESVVAPQFLLWEPNDNRPWMALQVGERADVSAAGTLLALHFQTEGGEPVGLSSEVRLASMATWGDPADNGPVVLAVPDGASQLVVRQLRPGCDLPAEVVMDVESGLRVVPPAGCDVP